MSVGLNFLALVLYLVAGGYYATRLALSNAPEKPYSFPRWIARIGIVLQFLAIGAYCVSVKKSPFAGMYGTLTFAGWIVAAAFVIFEARTKAGVVGAFALLCASLFTCRALLISPEAVMRDAMLSNPIISLHVIAFFLSFGLFAIAASAAALYLWQDRELKRKQVRLSFRKLPSLQTLDNAAWHSVALAFPLMTIGLALGIMRVFGGGLTHTPIQWFADPRNIMSLIAWGAFAFYLAARLSGGWYGARLQYILLIGMGLTLLMTFMPSMPHRTL